MSKPDYGVKEDILLPWYTELMKQYTAGKYGQWAGNDALAEAYEDLAVSAGEKWYKP